MDRRTMKNRSTQALPLTPQAFTAKIEELIVAKQFDEAEQLIASYQTEQNNEVRDTVRMERASTWLVESKEIHKFYSRLVEKEDYEFVDLAGFENCEAEEFDALAPLHKQGPGKILFPSNRNPVQYAGSLEGINPDIALSADKGFFKDTGQQCADYVYTAHNVRFCVAHPRARTCFDKEHTYQPSRSGSLARRVPLNIARDVRETLPSAYILPFPYGSGNYYHSFAEMLYGLRHIHKISDTVPIVFDEDRFNLLPLFCRALSVDVSRLVKASDLEAFSISYAVMPDSPPFYWDASVVAFFQSVGEKILRETSCETEKAEKIYISRGRASRRPPGEEHLETRLRGAGFKIVHAELLTIEQQVELFSEARQIIATHGAGLTNLVFCRPEFHLVEIFNPNYIAPDFFHRMKSLDMRYNYVLADDDGKYIDQVISLIDG